MGKQKTLQRSEDRQAAWAFPPPCQNHRVSETHGKAPSTWSDQVFGLWVRLYPTSREIQVGFTFKEF